jgi:uncharacterized protein (DUF2147 family)
MKFLSILFSLSLVAFSADSYAPAYNADDIIGVWQPSNKRSKVEIFKRGNAYFGKVVWLLEPNDANGNPRMDIKNEKESLRKKPLLGLEMLKGFEYDADDKAWDDGTIYDPNEGETYSCIIKMKDKNHLDVRGYIGFSLIGRSDTWTRVN